MADPEKDASPQEAASPKAGLGAFLRSRRFLVAVAGTLGSAGLAFLFTYVLFPPQDLAGAEKHQVQEEPELDMTRELVDLPMVQVTLADEERDGFVRCELKMQVSCTDVNRVRRRVEGELGIVIRDALITRISGKTAGALKTTEGKEILKLELIELLDSLVFPDSREGKVTALFYHDLLVQ